jgi:hypothetical protein
MEIHCDIFKINKIDAYFASLMLMFDILETLLEKFRN